MSIHNTIAVTVAWTFYQRVRGLLGQPVPIPGTGLLIPRWRAVHTYGMGYPIDVVFLDSDHRILSIHEALVPRRCVWQRGATAVLEMAAGEATASGVFAGQHLHMLVLAA